MTTYAIIGTGAASEAAITESLRDVLTPDDNVLIGWIGRPMPESIETIYGYLLDNEFQFSLYHRPEQEVTRHFRDADNCTVTQSRHPLDAMLKDADEILFLWDDDENDATPPLIQYVFDHINTGVKVKELSNGLAPIVIEDDMPEPEPAPVEDPDDIDDTRFTRDELEVMTAAAVKRYGERLGCEAKTKSGIIDELFGEIEDAQTESPALLQEDDDDDDMPIVSGDTQHVSAPNWDQELTILINNFMNFQKPGFNSDMAHLALGQARLWMLKALSE
jgi:hypothetical protein